MRDEAERREAIETAHAEGVAAANTLGEGLSHKADRRDVWKVAAVVACLGAALAITVSMAAAYQIVHLQAERAAEQAKFTAEQERTRQAIAALEEANRDLQARGQQPIPHPPDLEASETLVAAATARVLATLPPAPTPSAQQVGDAVASYMVTHPVGASPTLVAQQVAGYLAANPPPAGPQGEKGDAGDKGEPGDEGPPGEPGEKGEPGRTPTAEEIVAAFSQAAAQNPDLLCAGKGKFTEVRGFVQVPPDLLPQERAFWVCLPQ